MNVTEIDKELKQMTNMELLILIEKATRLVRRTSYHDPINAVRGDLRRSAEIMRAEYLNDRKLTELTVLDGEDFIDE